MIITDEVVRALDQLEKAIIQLADAQTALSVAREHLKELELSVQHATDHVANIRQHFYRTMEFQR